MAQAKPGPSFFALQRTQQRKSLLLLVPLILFYFLGVLLLALLTLGLLFVFTIGSVSVALSAQFILFLFGFSLIIAFIHFYDARRTGARFIRERLGAHPPDPSDRYHQQFANLVEEMRLASGLPKVQCYILSSVAINSMALAEADGTPSILISEGMLAECTREELQAAVAHELAHILRGDSFYVTLVCSLVNLFEQIRQSLEPAPTMANKDAIENNPAAGWMFSFTAAIPEAILKIFSMLLSRQREILADATAVQLTRNPLALARTIYKAQLQRSFIGDFSAAYGPLFIVPAESEGISEKEGLIAGLFSSHPPVMKRVDLLADMAGKCRAQIIEQTWHEHRDREKSKRILSIHQPRQTAGATEKPKTEDAPRPWQIRDSHGVWQGPFALTELLFLPFFSPLMTVRNTETQSEAPARQFPEILLALGQIAKRIPLGGASSGNCPRCKVKLQPITYEGVAIEVCPECEGKLVDTSSVERIIVRKEVGFSEELHQKAARYKDQFLTRGQGQGEADRRDGRSRPCCPNCGSQMMARPYSYNYFIPVDKCLACGRVWFDADELEILQILIEEKQVMRED